MNLLKPAVVFFVCILALAGCARTAAIANVTTPLAAHYSDDRVKNAILQAGLARQWKMTPVQPGIINGRLDLRGHQADIQIVYSATGYKINYITSKNLLADGKGHIHRNYNNWINNLDKDIQLKLSATAQ
ncbi:hypothetical protein [Sodalis sp. C49]|uniref:hypothetical protein n=1 Tax=Sodalis sp. C49 TaxID=3228929 RepID=UPI003965A5B6